MPRTKNAALFQGLAVLLGPPKHVTQRLHTDTELCDRGRLLEGQEQVHSRHVHADSDNRHSHGTRTDRTRREQLPGVRVSLI